MSARRPLVAVVGNGRAPPEVLELARAVGALLVDAGCRVVTGGLGGVMQAASCGARSSSAYQPGDVVGILPGTSAGDANDCVDIAITTGMGVARNTILVQSADAVVAVAGGAGTLSEIALAWQLDKPIVALGGSGWSGRLAGESLDDRARGAILRAHDPEGAVEQVRRALGIR